MRYCPLCIAEDRKQYGEAYWHRKHQLRNVNICTRHRCRLIATEVPAKSEHNYAFYPAETTIGGDSVIYENNPEAIRFASYVASIFDAPVDFEKDIPVSAILYHGMRRTKYMKPSGRSRYTKLLSEDMVAFYDKLGLCSIASMNQIQRVLLGSRFDFSVVCQIAFFLGMTVEELTQPSLSPSQIQSEQDSHYMKDTTPVDWKALDAETAPILEAVVRNVYDGSASENGRPERVSERLVYREMGLLGHQLENMPRCKEIFDQYTEPYPESWARKIIWAYRKLEEQGNLPCWSDIRSLSGVKKKNIDRIIPYLYAHADVKTVEKLTDIIYRTKK